MMPAGAAAETCPIRPDGRAGGAGGEPPGPLRARGHQAHGAGERRRAGPAPTETALRARPAADEGAYREAGSRRASSAPREGTSESSAGAAASDAGVVS